MKIKYLLVLLAIFVLTKIIFLEFFDKRSLKFYLYKTDDQFKKHIETEFSIGSKLDNAINIIQDSGGKCWFATVDQTDKEISRNQNSSLYVHPDTKFSCSCDYQEYFISLRPYACYHISFGADKDFKIVDLNAFRDKNCGGFWW